MRRATEAERAEQIERYKDAPIIVSVRPCIDNDGWQWRVGGPFRSEQGECSGEGDEALARRLAEEARVRIEADPETYNPSVIWIPEDDDFV